MRYLLTALLSLLPLSANAGRVVMENTATTSNTIFIDTATPRVAISTTGYGGGIPNVALVVSSNVVISSPTSSNNVVVYSTGSVVASKFLGDGSGLTSLTIPSSTIDTAKIATDAVITAKILTAAVTTIKIAVGAVDTDKLASDAVSSVKILPLSVTTSKIAESAINTSKIASAAVDTNKIASDAITTIKILNGAVTTPKVIDSAIDTAKIATDSVSTAKILNRSVTAAKVGSGSATSGYVLTADGSGNASFLAASGGTGATIGWSTAAITADQTTTSTNFVGKSTVTYTVQNTNSLILVCNNAFLRVAAANDVAHACFQVDGAYLTGMSATIGCFPRAFMTTAGRDYSTAGCYPIAPGTVSAAAHSFIFTIRSDSGATATLCSTAGGTELCSMFVIELEP